MPIAPETLFANLANQTRLRCVALLLRHPELCVCELTQALRMTQPHISRHLALLRESGLLVDRRAGLWVYYQVNPHLAEWMARMLRDLLDGVADRPPYCDDAATLAQMADRPGTSRCA
jgi:ArsR family transcriptional regulator